MPGPHLPERRLLSGWGRATPTAATVLRPSDPEQVAQVFADPPARGVLARGLGRAYGDAAQSAGGLVLDTTALAPHFHLDPESGIVTCSTGLSLEALLRLLVPRGWFVPVTPGTRQITVAGAIAADVHGKNHHVDGSFGNWLRWIDLVTPDGQLRRVSPSQQNGRDQDSALFWATVGGMGLTGVIVAAAFRCLPIAGGSMLVDTERTGSLDETLALLNATDEDHRYSVAWIDLLAGGRSVLTRGEHARDGLPERFEPRALLSAPPWSPPGLLNRHTVRAFNEFWFRKAPRLRRGERQPISGFFHPLDAVTNWNRLYGPHGLVQYQFVLPFGSEDTLRWVLARMEAESVPSFLSVLKRFGPGNDAPLSFPIPGWTLTLDIPLGSRAARLIGLLRSFDAAIADAGGRVYLAKDATLAPELLPAMYPRLGEFAAVRARVDPDGIMRSDLSRRLALDQVSKAPGSSGSEPSKGENQ